MAKNKKRILAGVISVLFTFSLCYVALLAPTSAFFSYDGTSGYKFVFGKYDSDLTFENVGHVELRAATRFADKGEILFDEVAYIMKVDAKNEGNAPARVHLNVDGLTSYPGLHYTFVSIPKKSDKTVKQEIDNILTKGGLTVKYYDESTCQLKGTAEDEALTPETEAAYEAQAKQILDDYNAGYILVEPQSQTQIYVVFWAEYGQDNIGLPLRQQNEGSRNPDDVFGSEKMLYADVQVTLTATTDADNVPVA